MAIGNVVNLKDIAEEAGVSVSTVSRVIKKKGEIAEETRKRILDIAKRRGYHGNRLSDAIRTGKTGLIGVCMSPTDPFFGQIVLGINKALLQNDYLPICISTSEDNAKILFHRLVEQRVDGMIIVPPVDTADNEYFQELSICGIPIVAMDREVPADVNFVGTDDYAGGWMNAEYFYSLGHRNMGYYAGPPLASSANLRHKGFRDFCEKHSDCSFVVFGNELWFADENAFILQQLKENPQVTCIGSFFDEYAFQLKYLAESLGRQVPKDLAISGFGNVPYKIMKEPFLTTFDQKPMELGRIAVECLLRHMNQKDLKTEKIRLKPELLIRQSTEYKITRGDLS